MFDIKIKGDECIIPTNQLLDLLNYKLYCLKEAYDKNSS